MSQQLTAKWSRPLAILPLCLIASPNNPIAIAGSSIVLCLLVCELPTPRGA